MDMAVPRCPDSPSYGRGFVFINSIYHFFSDRDVVVQRRCTEIDIANTTSLLIEYGAFTDERPA